MSDRARIQALTSIVQTAAAGNYTLPADVVEAHDVWKRLQQLELKPPRPLAIEDAAAKVVQAATAGDQVDPTKLCREYHKSQDDRRLYEEALTVLRAAVEQAAQIAVGTATDATERIITEHLRPAHDVLLEQARETAALLRPYTDGEYRISTQDLIAANSDAARAAYLALPGLVERRRLIVQARDRANVVGERRAQHDNGGLYATLAEPLALVQWRAPAPIPTLPIPEGATERLLWLASDVAAKARPWLPTLAEQDATWWAQFGEAIQRRLAASAASGSLGGTGSTARPMSERQTARHERLFGRLAGAVPVNGGPDK